jgi:ABC-type transport system substrate-binding protein
MLFNFESAYIYFYKEKLMNPKRLFVIVLTSVLVLTMFAACKKGGESAVKSTGSGKTILKVGLDSTLDTLNPWAVAKPSKSFICNVLYQPLALSLSVDSAEMQGVLAKSWEQVDDFTYRIHLYDYIKDTAGNSFNASDAIFSFKKYGEANASAIVAMNKEDDYTFTITLNSAAPGFFEVLAQECLMVTEKGYNDSGDSLSAKACGTSQYKLREFVTGSKVTIEKSDSYWQRPELNHPSYVANVEVIEYHILTEVTQLGLALERGTVQMALWVDGSLLDNLKTKSNLAFFDAPCTESRGIMFNMTEDSPFYNNLALRQAVAYAIDNQAVVDAATNGYGTVSKSIMNSQAVSVGFNPAWNNYPYSYDPDKAKALLAEAGYKPGQLTLRLLANNNVVISTLWEIVQANLMAVGINASIDVYDGSTYGSYRDGTSGMYELAYCGAQMGGYVTKMWDTTFNGNNRDSKRTWFGLADKTLQGYFDKVTVPGGFTDSNINTFYNYVADNCLYYQVIDLPTYLVYDKTKITTLYCDNKNFPIASTVILASGYDVFE